MSALIVSVLFGGIAQLAGAPAVAALSMLLGVLLCGLYVLTGSLLPGIALASGVGAWHGRRVQAAGGGDRHARRRLRRGRARAGLRAGAARARRESPAAAARQRGVRRAAAAAVLALALAGCGASGGPLQPVSAEPPAGAEPGGKVAERRGEQPGCRSVDLHAPATRR